jgi:hypothetical protein
MWSRLQSNSQTPAPTSKIAVTPCARLEATATVESRHAPTARAAP